MTAEETCRKYGLDPAPPGYRPLPGFSSRRTGQLLPIMLAAGKIIHQRYPDYQFIVPVIATEGPGISVEI